MKKYFSILLLWLTLFSGCSDINPSNNPDAIISFKDIVAAGICIRNFDLNGDGQLSYAEAAGVTTLDEETFAGTSIRSFDEFRFFLGIKTEKYWINDHVFENCRTLESIQLPNSFTMIPQSFFNGCSSLKSINLPEGITYIASNAFTDCSSLLEITLPTTIEGVDSPFGGCTGLKKFTIKAAEPLSEENCREIARSLVETSAVVYVPKKDLNYYQSSFSNEGFPKERIKSL